MSGSQLVLNTLVVAHELESDRSPITHSTFVCLSKLNRKPKFLVLLLTMSFNQHKHPHTNAKLKIISLAFIRKRYFSENLFEFWKANQWSCSGINILTRPSQAWVQNITGLHLLEQFKISLFSPTGKKSFQHPSDNHNQVNNFFLHNLST